MYLKEGKEKEYYDTLTNGLKILNEDGINAHDMYSKIKKSESFFNYLKHFNIRKIYQRVRITLYERIENKKNIENSLSINEINIYSDKKIAVYTSIYGPYDLIKEPIFVPDNCDFIIFTDQKLNSKTVWKKREVLDEGFEKLDNIKKNRYVKMNPHILLNDYEYSIYIDGSVWVISDLTELINRIGPYGFSCHRHSSRQCVYEELRAAKIYNKIDKKTFKMYESLFKDSYMPYNYGMLECAVIAREHNNEMCKKIMTQWWNIFSCYGGRDQLSLPYILYQNGIQVKDVCQLGNNMYRNFAYRIIQHA